MVLLRRTIEAAHAQGIRVNLRTSNPVPRDPQAWPGIAGRFSQFVLNAAELAESYKVELFTPWGEANQFIGREAANEWMQQMLPAIRARYSGKLVYQVAVARTWDMNFKGFNYVSIDYYYPVNKNLDLASFRLELRSHIDKAVGYANRDGLDGVLIGRSPS